MGGIIGKLSFEHDETLALPALEQMLDTLRHRGTTGRGLHVAPGIALGWCGREPSPITTPPVARNGDQTVRVVADSALTNARDLRRDLEQRGHRIHGRSDAAIIAFAYDEWGDACVEHLQGPFACGIWDERRERLLLARDSIGIRPLFFAVLHGHGVIFASEIRALLQDPGVGREWCAEAIDAYLALGYVPAPLTAYQRVSKLEPAQRLIVEGRRFHLDQYWDLPENDGSTTADPAEALEDALRNAVRTQLGDPASRVILYSGGLASTALLATTPAAVDPVFVASHDEETEIERSIAAARRLGTMPWVELAVPDVPAIAPQLAACFDEPLADPAAVTHFSAFAAASQYTTSALAGYGAAALWHEFPADGVGSGPPAVTLWDNTQRRELYTRGFAWQLRDADPLARHRELLATRAMGAIAERSRYVEARTTLPDSRLAFAERVALAAGIELHLPFLDRAVVELACTIRRPVARTPVASAGPLATLLGRRLPFSLMPPALTRTRMAAPPWLATAITSMVPSVLLGARFDGRGIVSRPVVRRLWEDHAAGRANHTQRLWSLLMLEFWFREYVDGNAAADEPFEYAILRAA